MPTRASELKQRQEVLLGYGERLKVVEAAWVEHRTLLAQSLSAPQFSKVAHAFRSFERANIQRDVVFRKVDNPSQFAGGVEMTDEEAKFSKTQYR